MVGATQFRANMVTIVTLKPKFLYVFLSPVMPLMPALQTRCVLKEPQIVIVTRALNLLVQLAAGQTVVRKVTRVM